MNRTITLWLLAAIVISGVGIRSFQLTARSLWFDEAFSWRLVQFPVNELVSRDAQDVHPPLYYLLLQLWTRVFGPSLLALRSFSVFFSGVTMATAYLLVSFGFRSRIAGLLAALFVALSGFQIQYGWEARMYTLGSALALWSSFALLKSVRSAGVTSLGWWLVYAVAAASFLYTHYYAFFTVAAHALFALGYFIVKTKGRVGEIIQSSSFWYGLVSAIVIVVLYLPWLPTFISQNRQVQASYWIPPIGGWVIPDTFYRLFFPTPGIPPHDTIIGAVSTVLPMMAVFLASVCLLWLVSRLKQNTDAAWLLVLGAFIPFIISVTISLLSDQSLYQDRFFVFAHLFILTIFAALAVYLSNKWLRRFAGTLVIIALAWGSWHYWQELRIPEKPGARQAVADLYALRQNNEPILVSSPFIYFSILYYATAEHDSTEPKLYSETGELSHFSGGPILTASDIQGPEVFSSTSASLWIVDTSGFGGQPLKLPAGWRLESERSYPEVFAHQGDITIRHYVRL